MSEHVEATAAAHGPGTHAAGGHAHPTAKKYLGIAIVLTIVTVIEVAIFYMPTMKPVLAPVLLTLSALKFALVVLFYMHLKFDHRLFSWVFVVPFCFAAAIILALLALFAVSHRA